MFETNRKNLHKKSTKNTLRKSLEKQKQEILENFCFEQVAMIMSMPCMPVFDGEYSDIIGYTPWHILTDKGCKIPEISYLRNLANHLLDDIINKVVSSKEDHYSIHTGPFKVVYRYGFIELAFVVESWSAE